MTTEQQTVHNLHNAGRGVLAAMRAMDTGDLEAATTVLDQLTEGEQRSLAWAAIGAAQSCRTAIPADSADIYRILGEQLDRNEQRQLDELDFMNGDTDDQ